MQQFLTYLQPVFDFLKNFFSSSPPELLIVTGAGIVGFFFILFFTGRRKEIPESVEETYNAYLQIGNFPKAAEVLHQHGLTSLSVKILENAEAKFFLAKMYEISGEYEKAGEIYQDLGRTERSIEAFIKAGKVLRAESVLRERGDLAGAALISEKHGENYSAARDYEEAEMYASAGEAYEKVGDYLKAGECWEKAWERVRRTSGAALFSGSEFARRAAVCYEKAGDLKRAVEMAGYSGDFILAAQLAEKAGKPVEAAEYYYCGGDIEKARKIALSLESYTPEARDVLARIFEKTGEYKRAALLYQEIGDFRKAGELFERSGELTLAAASYEKAGDFEKAYNLYASAGDSGKAGEMAEKLGRFEEAAAYYQKAGNILKQTTCLVRAGKTFEAAKILMDQGLFERALAVLQKIPPEHPRYGEALKDLVKVLRIKGMNEVAREKLEVYLGGKDVNSENVDLFYALAEIYEEENLYKKALEIYRRINLAGVKPEKAKSKIEEIESLSRQVTTPPPEETKSLEHTDTEEFKRKYQIIEEIGRGGMGVVYKARDLFLDRLVALKILPKSVRDNPRAQKYLMREAKAAASLNHPNIVTVYEAGFLGGILYIAMEYIDGITLAKVKEEKGPLDEKMFIYIFAQVARALAYAHKMGIVHGDVKPGNIMWTESKVVKITDFGLARALDEVSGSVTVVGGGTPYYMSPEQVLGSGIDQRSDIYSLGVTMYEMVTGRPPFTEGDIGYHHIHTPPPPPSRFKENISPEIEKIIMKCLEKDPSNRYQNMEDIFNELKSLVKK